MTDPKNQSVEPNFVLVDEPEDLPPGPSVRERNIRIWADWLNLGKPLIMGILNVTPDSFSDGGDYYDLAAAIKRSEQIWAEGADLIDVGGESTRPGAVAVDVQTELDRVMPIVNKNAEVGNPLSIDTRNAEVMRQAIGRMGIHGRTCVINDVSALTHDAESLSVVADSEALVILMHMVGDPATMNDNPHYEDVVVEVRDYLAGRADAAIEAGISKERIAIDPGLGFGKSHQHNLALLHNLEQLVALGYPVMVGASRKLAAWSATDMVRLAASTTAAIVAAQQGAAIIRVHDVTETRVALKIAGFDI
jgi:dihydropteroate synthase